MNWFTENKIFSSILVVIIAAILGVAYLTFAQNSKYTEAVATYQSSMQTLAGFRGLAPYRDSENLNKFAAEVANYKELTDNLHNDLLKKQGSITPVEPAEFQGRLRDAVSKTIAHANQRGVKLGAKFYLGFEKYENELPRNDITGLLNWQLTAIDAVINRLIALKVAEILPIVRPPLPGELTPDTPAKEIPLLKKYPFAVSFLAYPGNVQTILNDLVAFQQFTVARAVKIENEQPKGPLRDNEVAAAPTEGVAPAEPAVDKIIIGKEKVKASIIVDLVQFTPPSASPTPKK